MAKRSAEPKTKAAILASGRVTVTPPEQVSRWTYRCGPLDFAPLDPSERAELRRARSSALPKWLQPAERVTFASLPGGRAPGWFNGFGSFRAGWSDKGGEINVSRSGRERLAEPSVSDWVKGAGLRAGDITIPAGAWWERKSIRHMTPSQLDAELAREAKRLAGGLDTYLKGADDNVPTDD